MAAVDAVRPYSRKSPLGRRECFEPHQRLRSQSVVTNQPNLSFASGDPDSEKHAGTINTLSRTSANQSQDNRFKQIYNQLLQLGDF